MPIRRWNPESPITACPADAAMSEVTWRSAGWGIFFCLIFTVASAYSGLKVGQVMEAAIPISILAIGLARIYRRRSTILENVIVTGIGGVAGSVVAGAIFTLPALYILNLDPHPVQTIFICIAGGCLGVLFLIPLRRYFVREMHGQFPYPEATAITEVLVTGEKGGPRRVSCLRRPLLPAVYDFFVTTFQVWKEFVDFQFIPVVRTLAEQRQGGFQFRRHQFHPGPWLRHGLALLHGALRGRRPRQLRSRAADLDDRPAVPGFAVYPATMPIAEMTANEIFRSYVRFIGVGAIATAGIFGIVKSLKIVAGSFAIAARTFRRAQRAGWSARTATSP